MEWESSHYESSLFPWLIFFLLSGTMLTSLRGSRVSLIEFPKLQEPTGAQFLMRWRVVMLSCHQLKARHGVSQEGHWLWGQTMYSGSNPGSTTDYLTCAWLIPPSLYLLVLKMKYINLFIIKLLLGEVNEIMYVLMGLGQAWGWISREWTCVKHMVGSH